MRSFGCWEVALFIQLRLMLLLTTITASVASFELDMLERALRDAQCSGCVPSILLQVECLVTHCHLGQNINESTFQRDESDARNRNNILLFLKGIFMNILQIRPKVAASIAYFLKIVHIYRFRFRIVACLS